MEELEGKAQLVTTLITRQIVPDSQTVVAISVANVGRAPAEHIAIELQDSADYLIIKQAEELPILPPGRDRQFRFIVNPGVEDSFRTVFSIKYSDENGENRLIAFGQPTQRVAETSFWGY